MQLCVGHRTRSIKQERGIGEREKIRERETLMFIDATEDACVCVYVVLWLSAPKTPFCRREPLQLQLQTRQLCIGRPAVYRQASCV